MIDFRHVLVVLPESTVALHEQLIRHVLQRLLPEARLSFASSLEQFPCGDVDVMITRQMEWLPDAVKRYPRLQWLHLLSAGAERIAETGLSSDRCWISKSSGVNSDAIAEYVLAAILFFVKKFPRFIAQQHARRWARCWLDELAGKRAVLVGLGSVGSAIAERLALSNVEVVGVCRRVKPHAHVTSVTDSGSLPETAAGADILIVAAPLTPLTRGLVDRKVLSRMRRGSLLVDVSRGGVVVQDAIVEFLTNGHLGGAVLDVFEKEPLPEDSPLWDLPNVFITPHVSGTSNVFMQRALAIFERNLAGLRECGQLATPVDMKAGY